MNGYRPLILWIAMAATVGCHYRDPSIDLLEGELRYMEDQVYMLEDELHRRCTQLDSCRSQGQIISTPDATQTLRSPTNSAPAYQVMESTPQSQIESQVPAPQNGYEIVEPGRSFEDAEFSEEPIVEMPVLPQPTAVETPAYEPTRATDEPVPARPESVPAPNEYEIMGPEDISEPEIEIPSGDDAEGGFAPSPTDSMPVNQSDPQPSPAELPPGKPQLQEPRNSFDGNFQDAPPSGESPESDDAAPIDFSFRDITGESGMSVATASAETEASKRPVDAHVTHIVATAELAGERGFDDESTDADVLVVLEPRNKDGQYVELAGPVSVVVLDGNKEGAESRVARWDFDAGSARRLIRSSAFGRGIHLSLNWIDIEPEESDDLHVFVRYTNNEDRRLETDLRLEPNHDRSMNGQWRVVDRRSDSLSQSTAQPSWNNGNRSRAKSQPVGPSTPVTSGFKLQPIQTSFFEQQSMVQETAAVEPVEEVLIQNEPAVAIETAPIEQAPLERPEWSPYR